MKLKEFYRIISKKERIIDFLRRSGVLKPHLSCKKCGGDMYTDYNRDAFRCKQSVYILDRRKKRVRIKCDTFVSIYDGSWMSVIKNITQDVVAYETGMSIRTVRYWCRKIKHTMIIDIDNMVRLGSGGGIVEIDESKLGGRKLPRGREVKGLWVLGCIERDTGRSVIVPVPNRAGDTLIPIIQRVVSSRAVLVSDCWNGYQGLARRGYTHLRVNHKYCHVNPRNGAHTQNIERLWRNLKAYLPDNGVRESTIEGELARFTFLSTHQRRHRFETFLKLINIRNL